MQEEKYTIMIFAKTLCSLMEHKGVSQKDLAGIIGKPQSSISHYCSGKQVPTLFVAAKLCSFFGVTIQELTGESCPPSNIADSSCDPIVITKMIAELEADISVRLNKMKNSVRLKTL